MRNFLLINGKPILPVFTSFQARGQAVFHGFDKEGEEFVACRLDNRSDALLAGWYVLVSPEDMPLMRKYSWCANLCGSERKHIAVRRRFLTSLGEQHALLNQEIWHRMTGMYAAFVSLEGSPFDFRRSKLTDFRESPEEGLERCRGITKVGEGWQVQIAFKGNPLYIGTASSPEEGYRMYNRRLRELKEANPNDLEVQRKPYNAVEPVF